MNRFYEELSMNAWPSIKTDLYDGWVLRYSNGYTKRANSVYPLYDSQLPLGDKLKYCEAFYGANDMPTTFKMNDDEQLHALDIYLEDRGYHVLDPTDVMVLELDKNPLDDEVSYRVEDGYCEEAAKALAVVIGAVGEDERSRAVRKTMTTMMSHISPPSFYIFIERADEIIGFGNGVVEQGHLGIFNINIKEAYRGQGYGRQMMLALMKEGRAKGAHVSYLQVVCQNEVAINLYDSLGYTKVYRYWYRRKDMTPNA